eukprot:scaffold59450_cov57-Phaeocystis_antarctica.AAC.5
MSWKRLKGRVTTWCPRRNMLRIQFSCSERRSQTLEIAKPAGWSAPRPDPACVCTASKWRTTQPEAAQ